MCGIVGYLGESNAIEAVLNGLFKMEYRGYDSAGLSYVDKNQIHTLKTRGKVDNLSKLITEDLTSNLAIGHTRWATHGAPTKVNAHPHCSADGRFIIVHNGIIENYRNLKYTYLSDVEFKSETDTEVIVDLIAYFAKSMSVHWAIRKTMSILEGSYACLLIDKTNPRQIFFFKDKSPLLVGVGSKGVVLASDVIGLVGYADKYAVLDDKLMGVATAKELYAYDVLGLKKDCFYQPLKMSVNEIDKNNYEHFMLKEIYEQPYVIRNLITKYFKDDDVIISEKLVSKIRKADKINFVASGSSMYAAYFAKYYFEKLCCIPCEVFCSSELVYSTPLISKKPFFIFFSQSGETADAIAVLKKIKKQKYPSLTITNNMDSSMVRLSNFSLDLAAGKEIAVASTKAYTAMIALSSILARAVSGIKTNLKNNLKSVSLAMEKVLENQEVYKGIASDIAKSSSLFYIGRGIDYWTALESALKLKEIGYIHTEAFSSGELKHGPIALIGRGTPVVAIITQEGTNMITRSNLMETESRGAIPYVIAAKSLSTPKDNVIIPNVAHYLSPLISILVTQLLAYYVATIKNNDVDKPKNLAKSVTVE